MLLETVRISQSARDQLMRLKRDTGIQNWNVLCRWALCLSLAEPSIPPPAKIVADSNVEMKWETFGGEHADTYDVIFRQRCFEDGVELSDESIGEYFKLHLHRGIGYLFGDKKYRDIIGFIETTEVSR
jgi:DNA sulfur modification protein DndE